MKMKPLLLFIILYISYFTSIAQQGLRYAPNTVFVSDGNENFLISTKPVTNREYIIYLLWVKAVYAADYPVVLWEAFPGGNPLVDIYKMYEYKNNATFTNLLKYTPYYVCDYMFNPQYIDYPVIGVSQYQANLYCKWLSDRYNEYLLVKHNYLKYNILQLSEDCFITESYLVGQYIGLGANNKIEWENHLLVPSFRLPTQYEIDVTRERFVHTSDFKSYPYTQTHFLHQWHQWFLSVTKEEVLIQDLFGGGAETIKNSYKWDVSKYLFNELVLNNQALGKKMKALEIYNANEQQSQKIQDFEGQIKDSLGRQPFIIVDEDKNREAVVVPFYKNNVKSKIDTLHFSFFRYAASMKPNQYKP